MRDKQIKWLLALAVVFLVGLAVGRFQTASVVAPVAEAVVQQPAASEPELVYVTRTGDKYHRSGCRYLQYSSQELPLKEAARWYQPCSLCCPPAGR